MAVAKIDPKVIFASEAPAQDAPAVFTNKTVGWGESRKNGGRPTIKQSNALQQETDLKILWLNENSVTPFDATIDYPENAVTIKDGAFKIFNGSAWNLFLSKASVGLNNVDNTSDINKPISTATATALNLKADKATTYTKVEVDTTIDLLKPPYLSSNVIDASGETQQQVNYNGGAKWHSRVGGYLENERVVLANGDIVKSTVDGNVNDPNVDMTGWVNYELDQKIRNGQIINLVSDFKAVGGTDCSTQIRAAILEALRTGKALYVPSTTAPYQYAKNQLTFKIGVDVNDISPNACLFIYGDGPASQFKMMDGQIDQLYSSSFRFEISRNMGTFYFKDFFVDNNARGSAPPPDESKYIYEQSHTFSFAGGSGTTLDNITYENMIVKDPAADAFNNSYRGVCGTVRHINPSVRDRTRVRADIQEGFGAKNIIISNPLVHSIEAEATIAPTGGSTFIQVNGGTCEVLDIAGDSETDNLAVETNNLRVTGYTNLGLIKNLTVNGGQLRLNKDNPRFPYLKDALFNKVRVLHPYDPVTGAVTSIGYLRRTTCAGTIEWIEPEHVIDWEGALPVPPTGELITNSGGTSIVSADVGLYNLIIRRAKFDPRIPKSIYAYRMGTVVLDNNKYGGTDCAIDWYATSGSATDLTVIGGDYSKVTGTALKIGGVSAGHKLTLTGDNWTGAKASSWKLLTGSLSTYAPSIYNYRKLTVDALPTIALAKDVFQLGNIASAVGSVIEYRCTVSSLTAPNYVCSKQLGLYAAATASLPVLTASEKWARAHDTTTNTIKTWTGSTWI